jgi:hypothetical protein
MLVYDAIKWSTHQGSLSRSIRLLAMTTCKILLRIAVSSLGHNRAAAYIHYSSFGRGPFRGPGCSAPRDAGCGGRLHPPFPPALVDNLAHYGDRTLRYLQGRNALRQAGIASLPWHCPICQGRLSLCYRWSADSRI